MMARNLREVLTFMLLLINLLHPVCAARLVKREERCPVFKDQEWHKRNNQCLQGKEYHCFEDIDSFIVSEGCYLVKHCLKGAHPVVDDSEIVCHICITGFQSVDHLVSNAYGYSYCESLSPPCDPGYGLSECRAPTAESDRACTCNASLGYSPRSDSASCACFTVDDPCSGCTFSGCPDGAVKNDRGFCEPEERKPEFSTTTTPHSEGLSVTSPSRITPSASDTSSDVAVGLGIGIPIAILIAGVLLWYFCKCKRRWRRCISSEQQPPLKQYVEVQNNYINAKHANINLGGANTADTAVSIKNAYNPSFPAGNESGIRNTENSSPPSNGIANGGPGHHPSSIPPERPLQEIPAAEEPGSTPSASDSQAPRPITPPPISETSVPSTGTCSQEEAEALLPTAPPESLPPLPPTLPTAQTPGPDTPPSVPGVSVPSPRTSSHEEAEPLLPTAPPESLPPPPPLPSAPPLSLPLEDQDQLVDEGGTTPIEENSEETFVKKPEHTERKDPVSRDDYDNDISEETELKTPLLGQPEQTEAKLPFMPGAGGDGMLSCMASQGSPLSDDLEETLVKHPADNESTGRLMMGNSLGLSAAETVIEDEEGDVSIR